MTKYRIIAFAILIATVAFLWIRNAHLRDERDRYQRNTKAMLSDLEQFKVRDSLNGARIGGLELTISELKEYRAQDAELVKTLRIKARDLQSISNAQTQTIAELSAIARDTVVIRDTVTVPAKHIDIHDAWYDFEGILCDNEFRGTMTSRDSLVVVETCKMSRCIIKKWRKVKSRSIEIISKNPNTHIENIEYICIKK